MVSVTRTNAASAELFRIQVLVTFVLAMALAAIYILAWSMDEGIGRPFGSWRSTCWTALTALVIGIASAIIGVGIPKSAHALPPYIGLTLPGILLVSQVGKSDGGEQSLGKKLASVGTSILLRLLLTRMSLDRQRWSSVQLDTDWRDDQLAQASRFYYYRLRNLVETDTRSPRAWRTRRLKALDSHHDAISTALDAARAYDIELARQARFEAELAFLTMVGCAWSWGYRGVADQVRRDMKERGKV